MNKVITIFLLLLSLAVGTTVFQNCSKVGENSKSESASNLRMYYWVESNFSCTTQSGNSIQTYRGKIGFDAKNFFVYGNGCNDTVQTFEKANSAFTQSDTQITYQGNIYQYMAEEPQFP